MNYQPNKTASNPDTVSTITKHIKLYSDNPIHDAIDRIIESCEGLDEANQHAFYHSLCLKAAAEELCELACERAAQETELYQWRMHNGTPT
jgi:hypothetical protein